MRISTQIKYCQHSKNNVKQLGINKSRLRYAFFFSFHSLEQSAYQQDEFQIISLLSLQHNKVHSTYYTISMHTAYANQKMSQLFDDFCCFHKKISYSSNQCMYCAIICKTCISIEKKHLNLLYGFIEFVPRMQASQEKKLTFLNGQMVTNKMYCEESNGFGIVVSFL